MLTRWSTGIRQQRSWLTLSYSVLPFLLALAVMELFKMATFPHSLLREQAHEVPAVIRSNRGIELVHAAPGEFEASGSRWDVMDCLNQNQESYRVCASAAGMHHAPCMQMPHGSPDPAQHACRSASHNASELHLLHEIHRPSLTPCCLTPFSRPTHSSQPLGRQP